MKQILKTKIFGLILITFFLAATAGAEIAQDNVIINSKDWRDVYSAVLYSNLNGKKSDFLLSPTFASFILNAVPRGSTVLAISSSNQPYVRGYQSILESNGYEGEEIIVGNANFELALELDEDITKFIIIDDTYGYNAISVGSYADLSKSYVLFANDVNINDIVDYLNLRTVDEIIIFGQVDRDVKDALEGFNPEIINVGDRFDNNLAIVDKYLEISPTKQATMTNGEFIEDSIMSGENPVIFIGRNNVPDTVRDYIQKSDFEVAVLIGNELVGPATYIKRQLGISVFVKFAQGARNPAGSIAEIEDLDRFPMPSYALRISIANIRYNTATRQLEVTYQNDEDLAAYLLPTINLIYNDEEELSVPTEQEPFFLDGGEIKTIGYPIEFEGPVPDSALADIYILFGEAPKSLEWAYQAQSEINFISVLDETELEIITVLYDKSRKRFEIEVENLKDINTYAAGEIVDLIINDEFRSYASDKVVMIKPFGKAKIYVRTPDFLDVDFDNNNFINVRVYYGQRERSLIKVAAGEYELILAKGAYLIYALIIILVVLLLLLFILSKKCENCKHSNLPTAKKCKKCGHKL